MGAVIVIVGAMGITKFVANGSRRMISEPQEPNSQVLSAIEESKNQKIPDSKQAAETPKGTFKSKKPIDTKLIWQQDFASLPDGKPDTRYWNTATPDLPIYNDEEQIYAAGSNNVRVQNGRLIIEAHANSSGYSSGRVDTKDKVNIEQGSRLEARIKLPKGQGTWPAFWLLSTNQPHSARLRPSQADWLGERFYMWDGEIDVMESYGSFPSVVEATVHTFNKSQERHKKVSSLYDDFHTYWVEWHEDKLVFGVDNTVYNTYTNQGSASVWPFTKDNQMYVILNLAMGGTGGGQIVRQSGDVWRMEVESIKYSRL